MGKRKRQQQQKYTSTASPSEDDLIAFDPHIAKAVAEFAEKNAPHVADTIRALVAVAIKTGAAPEKIYAVAKTGRLLTRDNMKFLSEAELEEWGDAAEEYRRLAGQAK